MPDPLLSDEELMRVFHGARDRLMWSGGSSARDSMLAALRAVEAAVLERTGLVDGEPFRVTLDILRAENAALRPPPTMAVAIAERLIRDFEDGQRRTDGSMALGPRRERWYIADAYRLATAIVGAAGGSDDD